MRFTVPPVIPPPMGVIATLLPTTKLLEAESMQELGATLTVAGDQGAARKWLKRALDVFLSLGATREADEASADLKALTEEG